MTATTSGSAASPPGDAAPPRSDPATWTVRELVMALSDLEDRHRSAPEGERGDIRRELRTVVLELRRRRHAIRALSDPRPWASDVVDAGDE